MNAALRGADLLWRADGTEVSTLSCPFTQIVYIPFFLSSWNSPDSMSTPTCIFLFLNCAINWVNMSDLRELSNLEKYSGKEYNLGNFKHKAFSMEAGY